MIYVLIFVVVVINFVLFLLFSCFVFLSKNKCLLQISTWCTFAKIVITRNKTKVNSLVHQSSDCEADVIPLCTPVGFIWLDRPPKYRCCMMCIGCRMICICWVSIWGKRPVVHYVYVGCSRSNLMRRIILRYTAEKDYECITR